MWNVLNVQRRTNNGCEGWHNRFTRIVDKHHPNIWQLIKKLQEEEASVRGSMLQLRAGVQLNKPDRKVVARNACLDRLTGQYTQNLITQDALLTGISYNLK